MTLIQDALRRNARDRPAHIALVEGDGQVSYAELWSLVGRAAAWLAGRVDRGDRVGLMLGNSVDAVVWLYGVVSAGAIAVPIDADAQPKSLARVLDDSGARLLVVSERLAERAAAGALPDACRLVVAGDELPPAAAPAASGPGPGGTGADAGTVENRAGRDPRRAACILYTTGTTGAPKGVILTHANLLAATATINAFMQPADWIVESLPMRLSHSFGFARLRSALAVGGTAILEEGLVRVGPLFERMRQHGVNAFASVPAGFALLLDAYLEPFRSVGPALRLIEIGSAPMPRRHKALLAECCPNARICMHYGLTEASRACFLDFAADAASLDSVGRPSPGVSLRIVTDDGRPASPGEAGEIQIRGGMVTPGVWGRPDLTREAFADGWLRTGDLGSADEAGYVHLAGRRGDVLNLGGFKVAPAEIEERLREFDGVADAAVTLTREDQDGTPRLTALLVARPPSHAIDTAGLRAFCLETLEAWKVPSAFALVPSLPRTPSGKLQRHLLPGLRSESS